jgi:nucleoid DNA-binding protein
MMDNHSTKGKSGLIRDLMDKGFSVRRATKAVNAVFDSITRAVWRGEIVEIPGGTIQARSRKGTQRPRILSLRDVQTGRNRLKLAKFPGQRRVVKFRPDLNLDLTPLPVPPPPPTPEEIECRQLAAALLGHAVDDKTMGILQQSADFPRPKPGNLLRRLREAKSRSWYSKSTDELAHSIRQLYWV